MGCFFSCVLNSSWQVWHQQKSVDSSMNCIWSTDEDCFGSIKDSRFLALPFYLGIDRIEMPTVFQKERNLPLGLCNLTRNKECSDVRIFVFISVFPFLLYLLPLYIRTCG